MPMKRNIGSPLKNDMFHQLQASQTKRACKNADDLHATILVDQDNLGKNMFFKARLDEEEDSGIKSGREIIVFKLALIKLLLCFQFEILNLSPVCLAIIRYE